MICGTSGAAGVTVTPPCRLPESVGANTTVIVHDLPAPTLEPQVLVWEYSPLVATLVIGKAEFPLLVSVNVCVLVVVIAVSGNCLRGDGVIVATVPVANRLVTDGLPGALVTTVSLPVRDPACVGVTETLILQVLPLVRVVGQLFVCVKSPVVVI